MKKQFKYDDAYLYDLEVPVLPRPQMAWEDFAYDYEAPADLGMKIMHVLDRSYFNYMIGIDSDKYWNFYTDCEPSVFKLIYERALMEKYYEDTEVFCLTQNEVNERLDSLIPEMTGRNGWCVYNSNWEQEQKLWQPAVLITSEENAGQRQIKLNDPYVYDLDVPVYSGTELEAEPGDYAYDYEAPADLDLKIMHVLQRTYHSHIGCYDDDESIVHFYTDCEPDSFKLVYERALMEKFYEETGQYCLSKNEEAGGLGSLIQAAAQKQDAATFAREKLLENAQKLLQIYKLAGGK